MTSGGQPGETVQARDPLVAHMPLAAFAVGADGRILRANSAAVELSGESEEALLGRALWEVLPWSLEAELRRALSSSDALTDVDAAPDDAVDVDSRRLVRVIAASPGDDVAAWCVVADFAAVTAWRRRMAGMQALAAALTAAATHADITDVVLRIGRELVAAEEDLALIDRLEAGDGIEERRLADARLADHGDVLTRGELERYLVQHGSSAVALADSDEPEHS